MNAQGSKMFGEKNLTLSIQVIKLQVREEKHLKPDNYGKQLLILKFNQELHICFIKMLAIENQISKILEQLNQVIFVRKSFNTHQNKK